MLATIGPTRALANGQSYEEVNGNISPDEGFEGNDEDFYNKDKMFDYWHKVPEEGPKSNPGPGYG